MKRMTTKTIFNTDAVLKRAAMKKARKEGLSLSAVLNMSLRAYTSDKLKLIALDESLERGFADIKAGRVTPAEEVFERLGI